MFSGLKIFVLVKLCSDELVVCLMSCVMRK